MPQETHQHASTFSVPVHEPTGQPNINLDGQWLRRRIRGGQYLWTDVREERHGDDFRHFYSFAAVIGEGPIDELIEVYFDGKPVDFKGMDARVYKGGINQPSDPATIVYANRHGLQLDKLPLYPGLSYIVFEDIPHGSIPWPIGTIDFVVQLPRRAA